MIKLYNFDVFSGELLKILKELNVKVDLIMFDPPFLPKTQEYSQIRESTRKKLKKINIPENYISQFTNLLNDLSTFLKKSGWIIFKADDYTARALFSSLNAPESNIEYISTIVWDKKIIGLGYYVRKRHELLEIYRLKNHGKNYFRRKPQKSQNKMITQFHGSSKGLSLPSVIQIMSNRAGVLGANNNKIEHINQTPIKLWEKLLYWFSPPDAIILDLFMGSGSIGVACKKMKLSYIGIEIDKEFYEIAMKNILNTNPMSILDNFM